ncbi:UNVERIFIED_CONTAM: Zinc finger BED domain-containing protein DAYSLEEPER [Sesamum latifolium]|uniref:Zinc finger BED domain-containing protein DAYSLEEPER n=1 Tax=Sesamum latifolium TaxID=2727402 RepID=A0AAW2UHR0_9LAMI
MENKKLSGGEELMSHVFRQEESRRELATMVILHDYPLLIVEHIGFRRFVASLQLYFNMVSRNTVKSDIMRIYGDEKVKCFQLLDKIKCRVAITTDMWTSNNNKKGFMAAIAHFVDDSWTYEVSF